MVDFSYINYEDVGSPSRELPLVESNKRKTYFTVGTVARKADGEVFRDMTFPGGETVRVMDRRVFENALAKADKFLNRNGRQQKATKNPA